MKLLLYIDGKKKEEKSLEGDLEKAIERMKTRHRLKGLNENWDIYLVCESKINELAECNSL